MRSKFVLVFTAFTIKAASIGCDAGYIESHFVEITGVTLDKGLEVYSERKEFTERELFITLQYQKDKKRAAQDDKRIQSYIY